MPPNDKETTDDFLKRALEGKGTTAGEVRGRGGQPSAAQLGAEAAPPIQVPGVAEPLPNPKLGIETEANRWQDPAFGSMMLGAGLEGLAMTVPPAAGAALAATAPRLMRGAKAIEAPGIAETLGGMGRVGASAGLAEKLSEQGRGTPFEPATEGVSNLLALLGPTGFKSLSRTMAPHVTPQTAKTARDAEKAGFALTPRQVAREAPSNFGAHSPYNNTVSNQIMSKAADGVAVPTITREWLGNTGKKLDQAYEFIFSDQNIFTAGPQQDQLVNIVMSGKGMNAQVDKFIDEAAKKVPYLTENILLPVKTGGFRNNPRFLPPDGPQLREARDMIRKLQGSKDPAVRHYGNEVWDHAMAHLEAADPHVGQQLKVTNGRYRSWKMLEDMNQDGRLVQGNVDPQWLNDRLSNGWGSKKYLHGQDRSEPGKLGIMGRDLRIRNEPQPEGTNMIPEALVMGTGGLIGGAIPFAMGQDQFSWPKTATAAAMGMTASYPARKSIVGGIKKGSSAAGRALQRIPAPQQADLATRSKLINRLVGSQENLSSILAKLAADQGAGEQ